MHSLFSQPRVFAALCLATLAACHSQPTHEAQLPWLPLEKNAEGKTIAFNLEFGDVPTGQPRSRTPILMESDFAIFHLRSQSSLGTFYLFDRPRGRMLAADFKTWLAALKTVPKGSRIAFWDTCCAPQWHEQDKEMEQAEKAIQEAGCVLWYGGAEEDGPNGPADENTHRVICTCEQRLLLPRVGGKTSP